MDKKDELKQRLIDGKLTQNYAQFLCGKDLKRILKEIGAELRTENKRIEINGEKYEIVEIPAKSAKVKKERKQKTRAQRQRENIEYKFKDAGAEFVACGKAFAEFIKRFGLGVAITFKACRYNVRKFFAFLRTKIKALFAKKPKNEEKTETVA